MRTVKPSPLAERFWLKVDRRGPNECWPWTAAVHKGYGVIGAGAPSRRSLRAHRVSYALSVGPIPDGLKVLHTCDNPPCVNPGHLFLGTQADNMSDMRSKGRAAHGDGSGSATLTASEVREIREVYSRASRGPGGRVRRGTLTNLASRYDGVSMHTIIDVVYGRTWKSEDARSRAEPS